MLNSLQIVRFLNYFRDDKKRPCRLWILGTSFSENWPPNKGDGSLSLRRGAILHDPCVRQIYDFVEEQ